MGGVLYYCAPGDNWGRRCAAPDVDVVNQGPTRPWEWRVNVIKVRCFKCGNAFHLTEQQIANALALEGITRKPAHYTVECPRCRRANKVSLKRVRLPEPERGEEGATEEQAEG
jgi:hypothetical protein